MSPRRTAGFLVLVLAFAAASWIGWWMVPAAALLWGALRPITRRPAGAAALAAGLAAAAWMTVNAVADLGSFSILAARLAGLLSLPAPALIAVSILLPALLAWSGAAVGTILRAPNHSQPNP